MRRLANLALICAVTVVTHAQVDGLGETEFPNSGAEEAQEPFLRGLLLLHSFEYEDAREAFAEARQIDKNFAMAYWGEAMTYNHPVWFTQNTDKAHAVLEELGLSLSKRLLVAPTEREKDYFRAVDLLYYSDEDKKARDFNYMAFMERMVEKYPDDLDARAFYALSLIGCSHDGRDFTLYMKAAAAAEEVFARNPKHPGAAHYLIHSYDDPIHAPLGLRAARAYADIAPSAAHALHMPTHIFTALGMWDRVVEMNEASYQASEERRIRRSLPISSRSYHAIHWKAYGLLQLSRFDDAAAALRSVMVDHKASGSRGRMAYSLALMRAAHLIDTEDWGGAFADITVDAKGLGLEARANHVFVNGLQALKQGDTDGASQHVKQLMDMEGKGKGRTVATILQHELKSLLLLEEGNPEEAVKLLRKATEIERAMPFDFGPPSPVKPSFELLGEVLIELEDYKAAQEAFTEALARTPKRARALRGLIHAATGAKDLDTAQHATRELKEITASVRGAAMER